jgi:hypothetical protein
MHLITIGCVLLLIPGVELIFTWMYIDKENYVNGSISLQEINPRINLQSYSHPYTITENNSAAGLSN